MLNIHSADRGVAAGEVRSGFNAIIQSISSDTLCLGAADLRKRLIKEDFPATIFALVHDSIVAYVREDLVEEYIQMAIECIQTDRGCSIKGAPIGVEADSEPGGSDDYSCGKLAEKYPELVKIV